MTKEVKYSIVGNPTTNDLLLFLDYLKLSQDCIDVFITQLRFDIATKKLNFIISLKSPNLFLPDSIEGAFITGVEIVDALPQVDVDWDINTLTQKINEMQAKNMKQELSTKQSFFSVTI